MDIVDRIRQLANQKKVSLTKIERALGFGNGTIGKWVKQSPSCEKIKLVADYLSTSTDYLIYGGSKSVNPLDKDEKELLTYYKELDDYEKGRVIGKAEELAEAARRRKAELEVSKKEKTEFKSKITLFPEPELTEEEDETEEEYIYLPLSDNPASAGTGMYLDGDYAESVRVRATPEARRSDFAVKVSGDSMEPRFRNGDIVLVSKEPVEIGETGIFVYEGDGYIKQLGEDCLISLNPAYPNIPIKDRDSFFCQGKVVAVLSPNKRRN